MRLGQGGLRLTLAAPPVRQSAGRTAPGDNAGAARVPELADQLRQYGVASVWNSRCALRRLAEIFTER